jgi:outer membrane protein OmpA-like peptidoglycan-associated protein
MSSQTPALRRAKTRILNLDSESASKRDIVRSGIHPERPAMSAFDKFFNDDHFGPNDNDERKFSPWFLGFAGLGIFALLGSTNGLFSSLGGSAKSKSGSVVVEASGKKKADLVSRTRSALGAAKVTGTAGALGVSLGSTSDRIRLSGQVASEEAKAEAARVAGLVPGVGSVDNRLTVKSVVVDTSVAEPVETTAAPDTSSAETTVAAETAPATTAAPAVAPVAGARLNGDVSEDGTVVLTGTLPDEKIRSIVVSAVAKALPAGNAVVDKIVLDPAISTEGLSLEFTGKARPELFEALQTTDLGIPGVSLALENSAVKIDAPLLETALNDLFKAEPILFGTGSSVIDAKSDATIAKAAALLQGEPVGNVTVEGFTDNTGSAAKNTKLSLARADAVLLALVDRGVAPERLTAKGFGPDRPLADNATPEGRAVNRRVEVVVTG